MSVYVVIHGCPFDGITVTGPFNDALDAICYAKRWFSDDWRVVEVMKPDYGEGDEDK